MNLHTAISQPWAIQPEKLNELHDVYRAHVNGQAIDLEAVEARIGKSLDNTRTPPAIINGVSVIQIHGVIAKRMNLMTEISGGVSSEIAAQEFRQALANPGVKAILLDIDSPGGTVDGVTELADLVYSTRGKKKVTAFANGTMASAAYWIGSAASSIYASSGTAVVGSIGVVAMHTDVSSAHGQAGIKNTEITAGKYKRIASRYAPLSDAGRQSIQDQVDYLYSLFVGAVARHRGTTTDDVLSGMADGRIFIGQQAIDADLIDGFSSMNELLTVLSNGNTPKPTPTKTHSDRRLDMSQYETIDETEVERRVRAAWERDPELRAEFCGNLDSCIAFHQADANGQVKIAGHKVVSRV